MFTVKGFLTLALATIVTASNVVDLTPDNFKSTVLSGKPALVEFFAPWCGHCKKLAPTWEELADSFSASHKQVTIAKLDGDAHKDLSAQYGITGFPTIKYFDGGDGLPEDYTGGRGLEQLQEYITERTKAKPKKAVQLPNEVKILQDGDFEKVVGGDQDVFVAFTAPWCGHCKNLKPTWERLASDFRSENVVIAQIDAEANQQVARKYEIRGFPTIKYFPKNNGTPLDYDEGRDPQALVDYVNSQAGTYRTIGGGLTATAGTVAALDELVSKVTGGSADLATVSESVKAAAEGLKDQYAQYYVKVLGKLAENKGWIEKESARLEGMLKKGGLGNTKIDDLTSRVNILKRFGVGSSDKSEL